MLSAWPTWVGLPRRKFETVPCARPASLASSNWTMIFLRARFKACAVKKSSWTNRRDRSCDSQGDCGGPVETRRSCVAAPTKTGRAGRLPSQESMKLSSKTSGEQLVHEVLGDSTLTEWPNPQFNTRCHRIKNAVDDAVNNLLTPLVMLVSIIVLWWGYEPLRTLNFSPSSTMPLSPCGPSSCREHCRVVGVLSVLEVAKEPIPIARGCVSTTLMTVLLTCSVKVEPDISYLPCSEFRTYAPLRAAIQAREAFIVSWLK